MIDSISQIILHTPWWVWLILVILIKSGLEASKTRVVSIKRLAILPSIFCYLTLSGLIKKPEVTSTLVWSLTLFLGCVIGIIKTKNKKFRTDQNNYLIEIPGNWSTLFLALTIFVTKYFFSYMESSYSSLSSKILFIILKFSISGIFIGFFIGKFLVYFYKILKGPSTELKTHL